MKKGTRVPNSSSESVLDGMIVNQKFDMVLICSLKYIPSSNGDFPTPKLEALNPRLSQISLGFFFLGEYFGVNNDKV